jgi:hypothetical protein
MWVETVSSNFVTKKHGSCLIEVVSSRNTTIFTSPTQLFTFGTVNGFINFNAESDDFAFYAGRGVHFTLIVGKTTYASLAIRNPCHFSTNTL